MPPPPARPAAGKAASEAAAAKGATQVRFTVTHKQRCNAAADTSACHTVFAGCMP